MRKLHNIAKQYFNSYFRVLILDVWPVVEMILVAMACRLWSQYAAHQQTCCNHTLRSKKYSMSQSALWRFVLAVAESWATEVSSSIQNISNKHPASSGATIWCKSLWNLQLLNPSTSELQVHDHPQQGLQPEILDGQSSRGRWHFVVSRGHWCHQRLRGLRAFQEKAVGWVRSPGRLRPRRNMHSCKLHLSSRVSFPLCRHCHWLSGPRAGS